MHRRTVNSAITSTNVYQTQFQQQQQQQQQQLQQQGPLSLSEHLQHQRLPSRHSEADEQDVMRNMQQSRRANSFLFLDDNIRRQAAGGNGSSTSASSEFEQRNSTTSATGATNELGLQQQSSRTQPLRNITPIDDMVFQNNSINRHRVGYSELSDSRTSFLSEFPADIGEQIWERVDQRGHDKPCPRSSSASIIHEDCLYLFGGFTFNGRLDEIYQYNFKTFKWVKIKTKGDKPSARENNGAVVFENKLYVYGGYDGVSWFKDFYSLNFDNFEWTRLPIQGDVPSQSFGFASGRYENTFSIFGGFEGTTWLNDYFSYDLTTHQWSKVQLSGQVPSERSCPSYCVKDEYLYIFGGFNGIDKLQDFYRINMKKAKCTFIQQKGSIPSPRYFHSQIFYDDKIYLFGGYNGQIRLNDLYEFSIATSKWNKIEQKDPPAGRSSMVLSIYSDSLFLFGGYNGFNVMNDFYQFRFTTAYLPRSQHAMDIFSLLDNPNLSDVKFLVDGKTIYANKCILSCRSEYFRTMFTTGLQESLSQHSEQLILVKDVAFDTFYDVLKYIYTDSIDAGISTERLQSILTLADLYFIDRLKYLCEERLAAAIQHKNVIDILLASEQSRSSYLKKYSMKYLLENLAEIKKSPSFQKLLPEPGLLMEIIMTLPG